MNVTQVAVSAAWLVIASLATSVVGANVAAADDFVPSTPYEPSWIPGTPQATPGSYSYPYNVIAVAPPATTDARGVRIGTNADPAASGTGLPGSRLGNSANKSNYLTSANARNGIQGGIAPPTAPSPGLQIGGGNESALLEDPHGLPPVSAAGTEATAPTVLPGNPGVPAPVLESTDGQPAKPKAPAGS